LIALRRRLLPLLASVSVIAGEQFPPVPRPLPALEIPGSLSLSTRGHDITVQDLLRIRSIGGLSISPNGRWVAFTLRQADLEANGYRTALFVTATSGRQQPLNLGSVGPVVFNDANYPVTIDPAWSSDSRYVLYPMPKVDPNGKLGKPQLFRWHREGGPPDQITHSATSILYAVGAADGRILYSALGKRPDLIALSKRYSDHGIWYFDLDNDPNSVGSVSPAFTRRGTDILDQALHHMRELYEPATEQWLDDVPYEVHVLDERSGRTWEASPDETKLYQNLAASHRNVSDWSTRLDDPSRVWIPDPGGSELSFQEKAHDGRDAPSAPSTLKGHSLLYSISRDGSKLRQVSLRPDYSYSHCSYSTAAKRFACVRENPQTPPEVVSFNSDSSAEEVLTDLNSEVRSWKLPAVELVEWNDSRGNPAFGYLYKPVGFGPGPFPTVILPYYSATYDFTESAVVANEYPTYVFTSRGYAVLRPDMRFYMVPSDSAPTLKLAMNEDSLSSILGGLQRLVRVGVADNERVGIAGLSMGAMWTCYAIAHSHVFRAASVPVIVPSPLNSNGAYYANAQVARDRLSKGDDGQTIQGTERAHLDESLIGSWPDSVSTPLLIDASDGEWVYSVQAAIALRTRGKPVEMVVYPDARHFKKWPRQIKSAWEMNLDWFDFWLRESRDNTPEKRGQYQRWEKMKSAGAQTGRKLP
jgi:dipeptidyl aminopeptidase/acylaminoacyl peptidase